MSRGRYDQPCDDRELDAYADRRLTRACARCGGDVAIVADEPFTISVFCDSCLEEMKVAITCNADLAATRRRA